MDAETKPDQRLRQHHLFSSLSAEEFEALRSGIDTRLLTRSEVLFLRGDRADYFYFVARGQIELSVLSAAGEKKVIEVVRPNQTFAEAVAFMNKTVYPVSACALSDGLVYRIRIRAYESMLTMNRTACFRLLGDVCQRLHARVREIENLTIQNARTRLCSYLLDQVESINDDKASINLELARHVIASRLSIKPETLSRLLRTMVEEGLIVVSGRTITLNSVSALRPYI